MPENQTNQEGEVLIVSQRKALTPDFLNAMFEFQHGGEEESDAGFEKMRKLASQSEQK